MSANSSSLSAGLLQVPRGIMLWPQFLDGCHVNEPLQIIERGLLVQISHHPQSKVCASGCLSWRQCHALGNKWLSVKTT